MNKFRFSIGAYGVIFNPAGEVLLSHRRDYDLWNLPGGATEKGETPWDACVREVHEETGLLVSVEYFIGVYSKPHNNDLVLCFSCKMVGGTLLQTTDEADDNRYFALTELPENLIKGHVTRIHHAKNFNGNTIFMHQPKPNREDAPWLYASSFPPL
ncbi:MAG TPA: NUDIX domain-containing protein [Patescibacteria group bacterium]|nr:NUDIX domain-containing protein [Patescibacteria group bacterium]